MRGARFRGHVRRNGRGPVYRTTCTVLASDPGREFAFPVARRRTNLSGMRVTLEKIKAAAETSP